MGNMRDIRNRRNLNFYKYGIYQRVLVVKYINWIKKMNEERSFTRIVESCMLTCFYRESDLVIKIRQLNTQIKPNQVLNKKENQASHENNQNACKIEPKDTTVLEGVFTFQSLPRECRFLFNNLNEVYEAFEQQAATLVSVGSSGVYVKLSVLTELRGQKTTKVCQFYLGLSEILQQQSTVKDSKYILLDEGQQVKIEMADENSREHYMPNSNDQNIEQIYSKVMIVNEAINSKWEAMNKQIQTLKKKDQQNSEKIQQLWAKQELSFKNIKNLQNQKQAAVLVNLQYRFSERRKNNQIILMGPKTIKCYKGDNIQKITLIQPVNYKKVRFIAEIFMLKLQINSVSDYVAVGMCRKKEVEKMAYRCPLQKVDGHGSYLLDWAGDTWSACLPADTKNNPEFKYNKGDTIQMVFHTGTMKLKFLKNSSQRILQMAIDPQIPADELSFCACICGLEDQVKILDNYQIPEPILHSSFKVVIQENPFKNAPQNLSFLSSLCKK